MAQCSGGARNNFDHGKNVHKTHDQIKGVGDVIAINSDSVSDYDEDSDYIPIMVKREDYDNRNDVYEVYPDENQDYVFIEDLNYIEEKNILA